MLSVSPLFREVSPTFFRVLSGKFAPVYWAVLETLYHLDFEGEPFEMTQDIAVEQAAQLLEQNPDFVSRPADFCKGLEEDWGPANDTAASVTESERAEEEREARKLARHLLKRLEQCGWFDYEYRQSKSGYVLNFRDYAARILHTLTQVARQEQPVFEGLAHGIKAALNQAELDEKPGIALYNAQKGTKDLVREIKILARNIHRYAERAVKEAATSQKLLELQFDIYQSKVVDSSYHRFKTSDNVFKYRSFILGQLEKLEGSAELMASAVQWISRNQAIGYGQADGVLDEWIALIRGQLSTIHLLTDDLDRKNARYTATTLQRISYLLNQDKNFQGRVGKILAEVAALEDSSGFDPALPCFRVSFMDPSSLYKPPKERVVSDAEPVPLQEISTERRREMAERTRKRMESQYSKAKVYDLARDLLEGRGGLRVEDLDLAEGRDLVRLIFLCYHGRDRRAPYTLDLAPNWKENLMEVGRFKVRAGEFCWKKEK